MVSFVSFCVGWANTKKLLMNASIFTIQPCDLHRPFFFSLITYSNTRYHKLCTSVSMAWQWISYLFRQRLSLFSSRSCLQWQSVSSTPFQWHALTLENISPLPMLLSLRVNHLMLSAGPGCHHYFPFKIISLKWHKYSPYAIITSVLYLK